MAPSDGPYENADWKSTDIPPTMQGMDYSPVFRYLTYARRRFRGEKRWDDRWVNSADQGPDLLLQVMPGSALRKEGVGEAQMMSPPLRIDQSGRLPREGGQVMRMVFDQEGAQDRPGPGRGLIGGLDDLLRRGPGPGLRHGPGTQGLRPQLGPLQVRGPQTAIRPRGLPPSAQGFQQAPFGEPFQAPGRSVQGGREPLTVIGRPCDQGQVPQDLPPQIHHLPGLLIRPQGQAGRIRPIQAGAATTDRRPQPHMHLPSGQALPRFQADRPA